MGLVVVAGTLTMFFTMQASALQVLGTAQVWLQEPPLAGSAGKLTQTTVTACRGGDSTFRASVPAVIRVNGSIYTNPDATGFARNCSVHHREIRQG